MSSAIYVRFDEDEGVSAEDWHSFCAEHGIVYSPYTAGRNVFYAGEVEATFGDSFPLDGTVPETSPVAYAEEVTFSTFYIGSAMPQVAEIARAFWLRFGGSVSADEELRRAFASVGSPTP